MKVRRKWGLLVGNSKGYQKHFKVK
ncbi:unnamed protein product, partial [Rotaria sp. Silwood2]